MSGGKKAAQMKAESKGYNSYKEMKEAEEKAREEKARQFRKHKQELYDKYEDVIFSKEHALEILKRKTQDLELSIIIEVGLKQKEG